ncbi:hypothetical protein TQ39_02600 [Ruthenibacterium lactatiformans]|uniref:HTH cro/C1-type domain-containing protein n=2 Tax=Ruthenibacterium lactatiformans TaxID=1550024 RepID=A0A0D8J2B7_9FIRM|nr:hypothetical protein TQ39_02600 [Ruthenibacterium lactatiformans]
MCKEVNKMRIDRVKLIAEMARQEITVNELAEKACVSRVTITAARGGKSCSRNSVLHIAHGLGVEVSELLPKED